MGKRKGVKLIQSNKKLHRRLRNNKKKIIGYFLIILGLSLIAYSAFSMIGFQRLRYLSPIISLGSYSKEGEIQTLLDKRDIPYSNIITESESVATVKIRDNGVVYLSTKRDLSKQITSLQLVLSKLTIEGKRFKSLDFRFDKPVINF
ncbi:hypothetical protein M1349_01090 [Patescibacteria group bacterium]|nr:hypothetical protein [Patescibacteria group bacterium]